jgi:hypothetical protein
MHLQYGHSVFERTYRIGADGKAHIDRISPRPAGTIAFWNVGVDGEVAGSSSGRLERSSPGLPAGATLFPAWWVW